MSAAGNDPAAGGGNTTPWYGTPEPALLGHLQTKGWDKLDPAAAAIAAATAHREAEVRIGVPADQLLRLPKDPNDKAAWSAVHQRLGAPDKPEGYEFGAAPEAIDADWYGRFTGIVRAAAHEMGVSKDAASRFVTDVVKMVSDDDAAERATSEAGRVAAQDRLKQSWGQNYQANEFLANQAVDRLGKLMGSDTLRTAVDQAKAAGVPMDGLMQMFLAIGQGLDEAKFVNANGGGAAGGAMTSEQALARYEQLTGQKIVNVGGTWQVRVANFGGGDQEFQKRLAAGDPKANEELASLRRLIVG